MTVKQICSAWVDFSKVDDSLTLYQFINKEITIVYDGKYYEMPYEMQTYKVRCFGKSDTKNATIEIY